MAKKRRRKKARRTGTKKRRALKRRRHRRTASAAPRRRRRAFRRKAKNPGRRKRHRVRGHFAKRRGKRRRVRAHMSNPHRRKHFRGRRRRRNPGGFFGDLAIAVLAGIGGFVGTFVLGYFITPAADMVEKGQLYRGGVGLAGAAGGAYLAKKHPMAGISLAIGSLLGAFGGFLTLQVLKVLPQKSAGTPAPATTTKGLGAVFTNNMSGYQQQLGGVGAVFTNNLAGYKQLQGYNQQLGAVFTNNMGDPGYTPPAPWMDRTPYDAPAGY